MEECEDCGYTCDTGEKLEKHRKVHAVGLRCNACDHTASSRAQWQDHVVSPCHVALLSCRESAKCTYIGETERSLKDHIRAVHAKNETKAYRCSKCDFVATTSLEIRKHAQEHKKDEIMASSTKVRGGAADDSRWK